MTAGAAIALGLLALAIEAGCDDNCYETRTWRGTIDLPAEPMLQFAIDRCRADPALCVRVCKIVMADVPHDRLDGCEVTFDDARVSVVGTYSNYLGGNNCTFLFPDASLVRP